MMFRAWMVKLKQGVLRDALGFPMLFATKTAAQEVAAQREGARAVKVSLKVSEL
jgi:hypothetical protein